MFSSMFSFIFHEISVMFRLGHEDERIRLGSVCQSAAIDFSNAQLQNFQQVIESNNLHHHMLLLIEFVNETRICFLQHTWVCRSINRKSRFCMAHGNIVKISTSHCSTSIKLLYLCFITSYIATSVPN